MALEGVDTPQSPAWWMVRLATKLQHRQEHLKDLQERYEGRPPMPWRDRVDLDQAWREFQRKSRTNFAELIVDACRERMQVAGFAPLSANAGDGTLDTFASQVWRANNLDVESRDVLEEMLSLGNGYMISGPPEDDDPDKISVITAEDPRQVITAHDPLNQRKVRAAFKLYYDDEEGADYAYLWLPGELHVAVRERSTRAGRFAQGPMAFAVRSFTPDDDLSQATLPGVVPVTRFRNRRGVGEFERHRDLLDRINYMILQRLVIATMQAFRQRALQITDNGDGSDPLPDKDESGVTIDYDKVFTADPGALWKLPPGVSIWESSINDLQGILSSVKDDVTHLSAVTRTPISYLMPEGANQSAEGANLMREGLIFKVEDRITRASQAFLDVMRIASQWAGHTDPEDLRILWAPADRLSLTERASAAAQVASIMPWRSVMTDVMQIPPAQVDVMEAERAADKLLAGLNAPQNPPQQPGQPVPAGQQNPPQQQPQPPSPPVPPQAGA